MSSPGRMSRVGGQPLPAGGSNKSRVMAATKTNYGLMDNRVLDFRPGQRKGVPVSVYVGALVLQEDDLPRVMTTHFSISVVDNAEFIISAK